MQSNSDAALASLAGEVNELSKQREGAMFEMGRRLVAIRQILRETNGENTASSPGSDGYPPKEWRKWMSDNLSISASHAGDCIRRFINPNLEAEIERKKAAKQLYHSPATITRCFKNIWPNLSQEQRDKVLDDIIAFAKATP